VDSSKCSFLVFGICSVGSLCPLRKHLRSLLDLEITVEYDRNTNGDQIRPHLSSSMRLQRRETIEWERATSERQLLGIQEKHPVPIEASAFGWMQEEGGLEPSSLPYSRNLQTLLTHRTYRTHKTHTPHTLGTQSWRSEMHAPITERTPIAINPRHSICGM
jgi:hypothetical protein